MNIYTFAMKNRDKADRIAIVADSTVDAKYMLSMRGVDVFEIELIDEAEAYDGAVLKLCDGSVPIYAVTEGKDNIVVRTKDMLYREINDLSRALVAACDVREAKKGRRKSRSRRSAVKTINDCIMKLGRAQKLLSRWTGENAAMFDSDEDAHVSSDQLES
jgi:hypothetical protein